MNPIASRCQCQRFKVIGWIWRDSTQEERTAVPEVQTAPPRPPLPPRRSG
jgi:hypothetical protein